MPTRLLLIEPEPDIAYCLDAMFTAAGYECVSSAGPAGARTLPRRARSPDVILLGVTPYGTDPPTLCRILKGLYPSAPLIVLTTDTRPPLRDDCLAAGADWVVLKPYDSDALEADVARLVERRPRRPPLRLLAAVP
jgi:DNA-binding response OmpR family regulator